MPLRYARKQAGLARGLQCRRTSGPFKPAPVFPLAGGCTNDALPTAIL
ncbi:hypothetical protein B4099_3296 [Heyndrickxia coagulans]|uniref:Uncharacterized protein n=1 Tax=Heyndrickxia coagulans TaxID=1398 RepID=A0A150KDC9_HEYCO|nr:hypothetical protein B4099_3296 [Heyndrickxia coagulans]